MTREEILAMKPGYELDTLVAIEVIGSITADKSNIEAFKVVWDLGLYHCSTDMADVWQVVEKLKGFFQLTRDFSQTSPKWHAAFSTADGVKGKTAPEAICKAALIAVLDL